MKLNTIVKDISPRFADCTFAIGEPNCNVEYINIGTEGTPSEPCVSLYLEQVPEDSAALLSGGCCMCLESCAPPGVNRILAPDMARLTALFNAIQALFLKSQQMARLTQRVFRESLNLQQLVDAATVIFDNPILVADLSHKILAMSQVEVDDFAWKNFQNQGYIPHHPEMQALFQEFLEKARHGIFLEMVHGKHKHNYFIRAALLSGNNLFGEMHVFSYHHELTQLDMEMAQMLGSLISVELMRHTIPFSGVSTSTDYLVLDLIKGNLSDEQSIQDRLRFVNWKPQRYKYLFLVNWENPDTNIDILDACMATISKDIGNGRSVLDGSVMVFLFDREQPLNARSAFYRQLEEHLENANLTGVLSIAFEQMSEAAYRYNQATRVMELNQKLHREDRLQLVDASAFELMLDQAGQNYDLYDYCHPLVRQLLAYDQERGTDNTKFLEAYIISGRSFSKAAVLLHTHRNTVIYRMKHIEEILDFDFSAEEYVFHLELSFRMLRFIRDRDAAKWEKRSEDPPPYI